MSVHAWCRDIERDEAVRAAEDNRPGPLPTLEEGIERQKHTAMTAGVKEGFVKADGEWKRLTDDKLRQLLVIPKTGLASSAVEPENKGDGMATNGLRTERVEIDLPPSPEPSVARVTLEFSGRLRAAPSQWPWDLILSGACVVRSEPGESVRVVDEVHFDDLANMSLERDAAIRERDELRARVDYLERDRKFWCFSSGAHEQAANVLRARVAEMEAAAKPAPAASGAAGTKPVAWAILRGGHFIVATVNEIAANESCKDHGGTVVALYAAPQPAKGWLTEKDREWLTYLLQNFPVSSAVNEWIHSLLARSTPPEVVLPRVYCYGGDGEPLVDLEDVRAALAAAGVTVKEVK